ncbi:glycosyl hydrolase 108 family protein [Chelatococcus sp. XZ-Ab1]|uniref:glycoside hydrolase family 108 protein n=1 Tax=Chelatococcus sp. XZ-Ab1 TaxID=3034027 RepID=UPI0023E385D6|nr:glycosyl hydrolase 108 family protein [Chelatococcus sp. XZ-Ab1]
MRENFPLSLEVIFEFEGGYSTLRSDPGNWTGGKVGVGELKGTKYGIAANSFPHLDIKNLTKAEAGEIYRTRYWNKVRCDQLPDGVDLATFDPAVNSGPARAAKWLQAALGVTQDGVVGPQTVSAAVQTPDKITVVKKLCAKRLGFLQALSTWRTFGKGWLRRVTAVEAKAIAWAAAAAGKKPEAVLASESNKASTSAKSNAGGAAATGAGGGAAGTQVDPSSLDASAVAVLIALGLAIAATIAMLAWRSHIQAQRARALSAPAMEG